MNQVMKRFAQVSRQGLRNANTGKIKGGRCMFGASVGAFLPLR
jgi:hypothetical protein